MTDKILSEQNGPVTTIVINRPKSKNALDNEAAHGLAAPQCRAILIKTTLRSVQVVDQDMRQ